MAMWEFPVTGTMAVTLYLDSDSYVVSTGDTATAEGSKKLNVSNIAVPSDGDDTNNYQSFLYKFFYLFGIVGEGDIQDEFTVDYTIKISDQLLEQGN